MKGGYVVKDAKTAEEMMPDSMEEYQRLADEIDRLQESDTARASRREISPHSNVPTPAELNDDGEGDLSDLRRQVAVECGASPECGTPLIQAPRPIELDKLQVFLRVIEVALTDARGEGRDNDWVATLDARDWIRAITWEQLQDMAPDAAPSADGFREWKEQLEEQWLDIDEQTRELDQRGPLPLREVTLYLIKILYLTVEGERELTRLNEVAAEVVAEIKTPEDAKSAVHQLAELLKGGVPRIKHVAASAAVNADKLQRLQYLAERRGITT